MTINEAGPFLQYLASTTVKSKHFSIESLVDIAYLKKKIALAIESYSDLIATLDAKVKMSDDGGKYIPIDATPEAKQDYEDFIKKNLELRKKDIEGLKLNFVPKAELFKVLEDTTLEIATTLILHLVKE